MSREMINTYEEQVNETEDVNRVYPLEDDLVFTTVMKNKDACIGLLETIFDGYKVQDIKYIDPPESLEGQKTIVFNPTQKSIRLDVYFQGNDNVYDIEIQRTNNKNLPKRARMYSSMMDANMLNKSLDYSRLKTSFVILICTFDLFKRNRALYFFESLCKDEPDLSLGDCRYTIFLNTTSSQSTTNKDMEAFFKYLNGGASTVGTGKESDSAFVRMLDEYVVGINGSEDWRHGHMKYELNLIEQYEKGETKGYSAGVAEGEARGEARGISIGKEQGISIGETRGETKATSRIVKGLKAIGLSDEDIARGTSISVEQVQNILKG